MVITGLLIPFVGTAAALLWAFGKVQEIMWTNEDVMYEDMD